jgi:hypothetical protein
VTTTNIKGKTVKSAPKVTQGPKKATATKTVKPAMPKRLSQQPKKLVATSQPHLSPIEEISDLLDSLPLDAFVELTHRLLTSIPTLPNGPTRTRVLLKIVALFAAEYGSTA